MKNWIKYIAGNLLVVVFYSQTAIGQTKEQLEKDRKAIIKEIEKTNQYLKSTQQEKYSAISEIKTIEKQVKDRSYLISTVQKELSTSEINLQKTEESKDSITEAYKKLVGQYKSILRYAYLDKLSNQKFSYLLSSESLNTFLLRYRYVKQFEAYQRAKKKDLMDLKLQLDKTTESITKTKEEKTYLLKLEQEQFQKLQAEKKKKDELLNTISTKESKLLADLNKKKKEREKLNSAIESIILAQLKVVKAEKETNPSRNNTDTKLNADFNQNKGKLPWPVNNGNITTHFGKQPHPTLKGITIESNGVDISCNVGSAVQSVFDGVVVGITKIIGSDHMVIVSHGNFYTVYSNVGSISVSKNDKVKRGQTLGSASTNEGGKGEVHFEIWQDKNKMNPETWLKK